MWSANLYCIVNECPCAAALTLYKQGLCEGEDEGKRASCYFAIAPHTVLETRSRGYSSTLSTPISVIGLTENPKASFVRTKITLFVFLPYLLVLCKNSNVADKV